MSNVSETPKERGEDAENASYQTVTHTDLLDVSERDLSVERVETYLKIA